MSGSELAEFMANEDIQSKGYFTIACNVPHYKNEIVSHTTNLHHPMVVQGLATEEEFVDQVVRWNPGHANPRNYAQFNIAVRGLQYFYKVTAE